MTIRRHTIDLASLWAVRGASVAQDLHTLEQLVALHKEMLVQIEQLDKISDKRLFPAKELVRSLNRMRERMNASLKYLAQEVAP